jgi:hypothetical protein
VHAKSSEKITQIIKTIASERHTADQPRSLKTSLWVQQQILGHYIDERD